MLRGKSHNDLKLCRKTAEGFAALGLHGVSLSAGETGRPRACLRKSPGTDGCRRSDKVQALVVVLSWKPPLRRACANAGEETLVGKPRALESTGPVRNGLPEHFVTSELVSWIS